MSTYQDKAKRFYDTVRAVCPIYVSIDNPSNPAASYRIRFPDGVSSQLQTAALAAAAAFDWSDAAQAAAVSAALPDLKTLRDNATAAVSSNNTYVALAAPTNAQVAAQVKALTQQNTVIIKALAVIAKQQIGDG